MTKILLIVPPNITYFSFTQPPQNTKSWKHKNGNEYGVIITDIPLGVLTLSSWLKEKNNADVKVIDFNTLIHKTWDHGGESGFDGWFQETLSSDEMIDFNPDVIGYSSLFITGYQNLLTLGSLTKKIFPNAFQIVGGNLATTMYSEIFADAPTVFNALCYGEGELPFSELLSTKNKQDYCDGSPNWITRKSIKRADMYEHNYIQCLDEIPYLDYSIIDIVDYHYSPTIKAYSGVKGQTNYITYMTSRGCPFFCTFCSAHTVHGRKMRYFSIDRIRRELSDLVEKYSIDTLVIEDDHFLSSKERALAILEIAQHLNLVCFFPNALALYALDREVLEALYNTGVRQLTLAVESGSARVLKHLMKKPLRLDITHEVAKNCAEIGIYTDCNIIIGMPGETKEDIEDTRKFLKTLSANWYRINVATPLAGSEMYIEAKKNNQIAGDIRSAGYKNCVVATDDFQPEEIEKIAYELNLELNFLHNLDIKNKNYERAITSFENVLRLKEDHALAWYCLAECNRQLGRVKIAQSFLDKALDIVKCDEMWSDFFKRYELI